MGANIDEVQGSKQSRGHHEAAAKRGAGMAQGTPREQHVTQRQQHGQRDNDDYKEGADCCAIKQPPPAGTISSQHSTAQTGHDTKALLTKGKARAMWDSTEVMQGCRNSLRRDHTMRRCRFLLAAQLLLCA